MKVKNGKLTLGASDTRYGNFVLTSQPEYWKISDINSRFGVRIHKTSIVGRTISLAVKEGLSSYINNICVVLFQTVMTVHDPDSMREIMDACSRAISRHPDFYGGEKDSSKIDDEEALEEVKAVQEVIETHGSDED